MTNQVDTIAATILKYLKDSGHISLIGRVVDALSSSSEYKNSKKRVVVTSAVELGSTDIKKINAYLVRHIGSEYELVQLVNKALVAGFTLQIDDTFIDASVLGKIDYVSNKLTVKE